VDTLHQAGLGVILDWSRPIFQGTPRFGTLHGEAVYEHADPRRGSIRLGHLYFNYGRDEVRNFLISQRPVLAQGIPCRRPAHRRGRSMLYLDYSRSSGQWIANRYGGARTWRPLNSSRASTRRPRPGAGLPHDRRGEHGLAAVSRPVYAGGLGFGFKWNMGWMHDTLDYFSKDPYTASTTTMT